MVLIADSPIAADRVPVSEPLGALIHNLARTYRIDFDKPWQALPKRHRALLLYGTGGERIAHSV